jgi:hypothetical protein
VVGQLHGELREMEEVVASAGRSSRYPRRPPSCVLAMAYRPLTRSQGWAVVGSRDCRRQRALDICVQTS